jgi:hypothetical protein
MCCLRQSMGPRPRTAAWLQKPRNASMARRPFLSSFSLVSSLRMPMGSKGKLLSTPVWCVCVCVCVCVCGWVGGL